MTKEELTKMKQLVGKTIRINYMDKQPEYTGATGKVEHVDDLGQLHGTWGGLAVIPEADKFEIL